jgi:predicted naringenin-chalcone synthase
MGYLYNLSCCLPSHEIAQMDLANYMQEQYNFDDSEKSKLRTMYQRSGIEKRHSCLPDFNGIKADKTLFKGKTEPGISERMSAYFEHAVPLAKKAALESMGNEPITHLITVSCTGMAAPGLDIMLVKELKLSENTQRSSVNFMGCYAMFHALKIANAFVESDSHAKVLIVAVELCTIHFTKDNTPEQMAANLLFGDGASACMVSKSKPKTKKYFSIGSFHSRIIPKGSNDMAWRIHEKSFLMTLSTYVPQLLEEGISGIVSSALIKSSLEKEDIFHWAFHPGGRKILEHLGKELALNRNQLWASYEVMRKVGNLSSVTLLFVLNEILQKENYQANQPVFSAGFGPGLTVETMILNK